MKIRNNSRILALVLALVMILPLISIPVFADGEESTTPAAPLFSENFDGKTRDDVLAGYPRSAQVVAAADTAHGDVIQISVAGQGAADYYLWQNNNNKWPISGEVVDGKISGTANNLTVPATDIPANDNDASKKVTINGTEYMVVTGAYADSKGGAGNVATPAKFKNSAITVADHSVITIEMDLYLPTGMKNATGVSGRIQGAKVSDGKAQNIELFEITADGTTATINKHENATIAKGSAMSVKLGEWVNLILEVDFTNKNVTVLVNEEFAFRTAGLANSWADVSAVNENTLQVQIDRGANPSDNVGDVQFDNVSIISGASGITYDVNAIKPVSIDFEEYEVGAQPSASFSDIANIDTTVSDAYGSKAWKIDFNNVGGTGNSDTGDKNIDKNPRIKTPAVSYDLHDKILYEVSYFFEPDASGRIQNQFNGVSACIGEATSQTSNLNFVDIYQISFGNGVAMIHPEGADLQAANASARSASFPVGKWMTVSTVIDLDTGVYDIYVDGELAIEGLQLNKGGNLTNISVSAEKLVLGKVNKVLGSGSFQIDNIKFMQSDAPTVKPVYKEVEDFSDYVYVIDKAASGLSMPSLATYKKIDDNVVVNIPMQAVSEEGYTLLRADGKKRFSDKPIEVLEYSDEEETIPSLISVDGEEFDIGYEEETGRYYAYFENVDGDDVWLSDNAYDPDSDNYDPYYLVPTSVAELAVGFGGNIAKSAIVKHKAYSYTDTDVVVLSADYFIEEGSKGIIEAQFESYKYDVTEDVEVDVDGEMQLQPQTVTNSGSWIQLYYFDLATGKFEGLDEYMTIGAWNNVKVFMNLDTGVCEIYLNGALVKTEEVGHENLTIGTSTTSSFTFAKIQRTTSFDGEIAGNVMVDNIGVSTNIPADSEYGDGYLSDEAYINNLSNLLVTVKDPSVRLENPNGIRFATKLDAAFKAGLLANLGEDAIVGMGTLIAPLDYVEMAGAFTKAALNEIEVPEDAASDVKYLDIPFVEFFDGAAGVDFGDDEVFTASIVDIKEANLMRDFAAVGYVMIQLPDGSTRTYYAKSYAVVSAAYAAKRTIAESETFDWTEEQLAVLNAYAEADVDGEIWIESPSGNSKNPVYDVQPMEEYTAAIDGRTFFAGYYDACKLTVTGPVEGFSVYYNGVIYEAVEGVVTIDALAPESDMFMAKVKFGILDAGEYTISIEYPLGSMDNPIEIESLAEALTADVPANGVVYYKWVADGAGFFTVTGATENGSVSIFNEMNYAMEIVDGIGSATVPYSNGDEITIMIATLGDEETPWETPAGEVTVSFETEAATMIEPPMMPGATPSINTEIASGAWAAYSGNPMVLGGKTFTLQDAEGIVLYYNNEFYMADDDGVITFTVVPSDDGNCTFLFKNTLEEVATINAVFTEPVGSMDNPDTLDLTDTSVMATANGYFVTWTAEEAGTFTLTIDAECTNWTYEIDNMTAGTYGDIHASNDVTVVATESVTVDAGDVLMIVFGTADWTEGEISFTVAFEAAEAEA